MNKIFFIIPLIASISVFENSYYTGSTIAAVNLAGGIIKAQHINIETKYKRSKCPVCKGKGWYISGDQISKVPCGYCEPDDKGSELIHPPIVIKPECKTKVYKK